jgi:hypothetical protein
MLRHERGASPPPLAKRRPELMIRPVERGQAEGSFTLCGFATSNALHQQGEQVKAARRFARIARCTGSTGIHAEE